MIVTPVKTKPSTPLILSATNELTEYMVDTGPTYLDFETTGLDMLDPDFRCVGVGIANSKYPQGVYAPINGTEDYEVLIPQLYELDLIGFNIGFDAKVLERMANDIDYQPERYPWIGDTMVLWKLLDNRGVQGQSWGLKVAQKEVLGWEDTNDRELKKNLIEKGICKKKIPPEILKKLQE